MLRGRSTEFAEKEDILARYAAQLLVAVAGHGVVVDHAGGLHQRVANCGADEAEAALRQILTQRVRFLGSRWDFAFPGILLGFAVHETPNIRVEAAKFLLHFQQGLGC